MSAILLSTHSFKLRFDDMDMYSHLNNARYFDFMGEARAEFILSLEPERACQYVLTAVDCQFIKPFVYPDQVTVKQFLRSCKRASFEMDYALYATSQPTVLAARGYAKLACIDAASQKICALPTRLAEYFEHAEQMDTLSF